MTTRERIQKKSRWLSVAEVSDLPGLEPEQVRTFIRRGQLDAVNVSTGKRPTYRVSPEALDEFLGARKV